MSPYTSAYAIGAPDDPRRLRPTRDNWGPLVVPAGKYFVLGDNRHNAMDSRYFGPLALVDVRGRAYKIYWPPDRVKSW